MAAPTVGAAWAVAGAPFAEREGAPGRGAEGRERQARGALGSRLWKGPRPQGRYCTEVKTLTKGSPRRRCVCLLGPWEQKAPERCRKPQKRIVSGSGGSRAGPGCWQGRGPPRPLSLARGRPSRAPRSFLHACSAPRLLAGLDFLVSKNPSKRGACPPPSELNRLL